jgi:hypothetical protein
MLLGATTQHYNRLLASLLAALNTLRDLTSADNVIVDALHTFSNPTDVWPEDEAVTARLEQQPVYYWINQRRIRLLLEACELQMSASNRSEQLLLPEKLTIEHALPQTWQHTWKLPDGADTEEARVARDAHVDLLGNLTLVTHELNSALSNAAWSSKRLELAKRSQLLVNQRLCRHETWDEQLIDARGAELTQMILATWPGPGDPVWAAET